MVKRALMLVVALCASVSLFSSATADDGAAPLAFNPARPAVGVWIGHVSWNEPPVSYVWVIYPDGTFSSGRLGRGESGGGTWGVHGDRLILKYADGFRYEGALRGDGYSGTAYEADGAAFGGFSMSRDLKAAA